MFTMFVHKCKCKPECSRNTIGQELIFKEERKDDKELVHTSSPLNRNKHQDKIGEQKWQRIFTHHWYIHSIEPINSLPTHSNSHRRKLSSVKYAQENVSHRHMKIYVSTFPFCCSKLCRAIAHDNDKINHGSECKCCPCECHNVNVKQLPFDCKIFGQRHMGSNANANDSIATTTNPWDSTWVIWDSTCVVSTRMKTLSIVLFLQRQH